MTIVIHIVDNVNSINFGIWNAALFGSSFLKNKYGINSYLVACQEQAQNSLYVEAATLIYAGNTPKINKLMSEFTQRGADAETTIIVTHGCWKNPTRLGYEFNKKGFRWVFSPHGMLEPWSMSQRWLKKQIYFHLFEKRYIQKADAIRAVSKNEQRNLKLSLNRDVVLIENGVSVTSLPKKNDAPIIFLFMARLHFKKGIVPLVNAWHRLMQKANAKLVIAGPDEGELSKIKPLLQRNITYAGAVYGDEKKKLLEQAHYYILPSYSEGFPSSVVEAMSCGAIPLISSGCNFQDVFDLHLGYQVEPNQNSIGAVLSMLQDKPFDHDLSKRIHEFINTHYSEPALGQRMWEMYQNLKE